MSELSKLQASVKEALKKEDLSQGKAAAQIGISSSIMSEWLKGTYKGDMDGITAKVERWLNSRFVKEKIKSTIQRKNEFLETETSRILTVVFEEAQSGPDIGLVTGAAGVGKTCTAFHYAQSRPNVWVVTADPSMKTPRAALKEVSEELGVSRVAGSSLLRSLVRRLKGTEGLLIIDEAQHLSSEAIDQIRALHDQAKIGIAFVGNSPLKDRIEGFARLPSHAQLFSRIGMRADLKKPSKNDVQLLLKGWELAESNLASVCETIASRPGALRLMEKVLRYAGREATHNKRSEIILDDIKASWRDLTASPFPKVGGMANA